MKIAPADMVPGRWYYMETGYKWVIRFTKLEEDDWGNKIYASDYVCLSDHSNRKPCVNYKNAVSLHEEIREATAEEVRSHWPDVVWNISDPLLNIIY